MNADDVKLYHVYDDLSQTPYNEGLGIHAGVSDRPPGPQRGITAKSLRNHLNWSHRNPTPYISLWDDWAKAEKEVERRLKMPNVDPRRSGASTSRGEVRVAVISRNRLLESDTVAFNLAEFLDRPGKKDLVASLRAKETLISPKEWLAMYSIPDDAVVKVMTFRDISRPVELSQMKKRAELTFRQRLKAMSARDYSECSGGSTGHIQAWTELRWRHVAPHVLEKRFLYPDGSLMFPTSTSQRKKQLGGTMARLRREIAYSFRKNSPDLGEKLYQGLLLAGSMSDPLWKTVAPYKALKSFQRSVMSTYRKVIPRLQTWPDGKDMIEYPDGRLDMLRNFTSWLSRNGTLRVIWDLNGLPLLREGDRDWVIREEKLVVEPIEKAIGI
ncbi:hypothetical protein QBC41DRAFT_315498 [Cercophora samala]|uniref:DUF7587 domain-containing protein n=1 Tax=Cercophora samala TaxID=330535 RepID=A0AA39ZI65_9PEZI|nr:hypothetical protein QBC41DRAFT_315498 [Cercophora samala]